MLNFLRLKGTEDNTVCTKLGLNYQGRQQRPQLAGITGQQRQLDNGVGTRVWSRSVGPLAGQAGRTTGETGYDQAWAALQAGVYGDLCFFPYLATPAYIL